MGQDITYATKSIFKNLLKSLISKRQSEVSGDAVICKESVE